VLPVIRPNQYLLALEEGVKSQYYLSHFQLIRQIRTRTEQKPWIYNKSIFTATNCMKNCIFWRLRTVNSLWSWEIKSVMRRAKGWAIALGFVTAASRITTRLFVTSLADCPLRPRPPISGHQRCSGRMVNLINISS